MTAATTAITFTSNFINRIEESRHNLNTYITTTKNKSNDICTKLHQEQHTEQENIDILLRQLKSLQHERGVVSAANNNSNKANGSDGGLVEQRKKLENKQLKFEEDIHLLTSKNLVDQEQLDEVKAEEKAIRQKANEVRAKKEEIEMARGITMEDLTKGLLNYKYTGLTFEKGDKAGDLSFKFTKLDKDDPSRPFTFTLSMNEDSEEYILSGVNPSLDVNKTNPILDELNKDGKSGFNSFAVGMRKLFVETL